LYLWHSAEWLSDGATELGERKFRAIHAAGIERLLISLDAAQMRRVSADPSPLTRAVRNTREHGFKVELLLGEPDWIWPERRAEPAGPPTSPASPPPPAAPPPPAPRGPPPPGGGDCPAPARGPPRGLSFWSPAPPKNPRARSEPPAPTPNPAPPRPREHINP